MLDGYYKAPQTLHTEQIFIPKLKAAEAPKAFQVEGKVQPRRWIVIYKATIVPPESGDFRFVGFADDFLVVRVGGRNVLDGSWSSEKLLPEANDSANAGPAPGYADRQGQRLAAGKWITMEAGASLEMEVMIGEGPGGDSSFFLFIQQRGVDSAPGDYPVFQLKDVEVPSWTDPDGVPSGFTKKKMVFGISDQ
jgi:hypothetical protein